MRIYLSPSVQEFNLDVDGVSEATTMNYIADALEPYLKVNAVGYTRNKRTQTLSEIINQSNAGNYDLHLAIHSNAAPGTAAGTVRGSRVYYYINSANGKKFAEIVAENTKNIYPIPQNVGTFPDSSLAELVKTRAPAIIHEVAFHDNVQDSAWIKNNIQNIATILAQSVVQYNGRKLIPVCISGTTPGSQFLFKGFVYAQVCNITTVLNVRRDPSASSPSVTQLRNGTQVVVTGPNQGAWTPIRINNTNGYVSSQYLCICNIPQVNDNSRLGTVVTQGGNLNIRQNPSATAPIIASAPNGSRLIVLEDAGAFYKVNFQGITGYASKSFVYL